MQSERQIQIELKLELPETMLNKINPIPKPELIFKTT